MNILFIGQDHTLLHEAKERAKAHGFTTTKRKPDLLIGIGGDGTLLHMERLHPDTPKMLVRGSDTCQKCSYETVEEALNALKTKKQTVEKKIKLEATIQRKKILALNDIAVRNKYTTHAIRFRILINGQQLDNGKVFIGDGIVLATPFGSTAYFHSITRERFTSGLGLAFNNTTTHHPPLHLKETDLVEVELLRGKAVVVADNNPKTYEINPGIDITIKKSKEAARIMRLR